ncbi:MAG: NAD-dependent epimerase/dehydratase family protein, partial [Candidatus Altiarchaeota archaeon]|nr:NAD-dependent epimerase/dehydratase family protein [Candidatus Altiarchaeota archaeon]
MSKVLVTGGAGFIGSNVVDLLIGKKYDVVVLDNLSTGKRENVNPKAKFIEMDIGDEKLDSVFRNEKPEYVVHHAAQIDVRKSIADPVFDSKVNIIGSINLLECCRRHGVKKIVYASSGGAVYGEPKYLPAGEDHPIQPLCPYGASKYVVEKYVELYGMNYGIDYTILRYANVYGPRQDPLGEAGVVAIFTGRFMEGKTPVIFGDGEQTRDFVYVKDVALANLMALEKKTNEKVFNIGSGVETSVNKIAQELKKLTNSKVNPTHSQDVKGEVRRISLKIERAKK